MAKTWQCAYDIVILSKKGRLKYNLMTWPNSCVIRDDDVFHCYNINLFSKSSNLISLIFKKNFKINMSIIGTYSLF